VLPFDDFADSSGNLARLLTWPARLEVFSLGDMVANFCGPWKLSGLPPFLARHKASLHTLVLGHCFGDDPISRGLTSPGWTPCGRRRSVTGRHMGLSPHPGRSSTPLAWKNSAGHSRFRNGDSRAYSTLASGKRLGFGRLLLLLCEGECRCGGWRFSLRRVMTRGQTPRIRSRRCILGIGWSDFGLRWEAWGYGWSEPTVSRDEFEGKVCADDLT